MKTLWDLLLQTGTVSLAALLLLAVKALLKDKLAPRWQYWLWALLGLRALIPARADSGVLLPLPLWLEQLKTGVESGLESAFGGPWHPVGPAHILPVFSGAPRSVTDWLFILWWAGVFLYLATRLGGYIRLRMLLRDGRPVSPALAQRISELCAAQGLKPCRALVAEGLPSAFVCGIFRPVLVLPAGEQTDEKVLLHELLHLRHRDPLQTAFWCVLRGLHWCNPFLQYVFDRIGNDLETLCDQRVLERLEAPERPEYGMILLTMAAGRYARMPGTSSVSNGSKNIARRIEAIARFKRYPRGMGLVALCITLLLAQPVLAGSLLTVEDRDLQPAGGQLEQALALTRVRRCTTLAGALDSYAKGLMLENGLYLAAASPLERQPALRQRMLDHEAQTNYAPWYLPAGRGLGYPDYDGGYQVCDLAQQPDGSYTGWLAFSVDAYDPGEGPELTWGGTVYGTGTCFVPVRAWQEGRHWVVAETGGESDRILSVKGYLQVITDPAGCDLPLGEPSAVQTPHGTVTVRRRSTHTVGNLSTVPGMFWSTTTFDRSYKPDALWQDHSVTSIVQYDCSDLSAIREFLTVRIRSFPDKKQAEAFVFAAEPAEYGMVGGNQYGSWYRTEARRLENPMQFISTVSYGGEIREPGPVWHRVEIKWDDAVVEQLLMGEVDHD